MAGLDKDFLDALPPDLRAEVLAAQRSPTHAALPAQRTPAPLSCSCCPSQSSLAVSNCGECQALLCAQCVARTHQTGASASHSMQPIDSRPKCSLCDAVFAAEQQYCIECNVGTCRSCDALLHAEAAAAHQRRSRPMVDAAALPIEASTAPVVMEPGGVAVDVPALLDCNTKSAVRALIGEWTAAFDEVGSAL